MNNFGRGAEVQIHPEPQSVICSRLLFQGDLSEVQAELVVLGVKVPQWSVACRVIEVVAVVGVDKTGQFCAAEEGKESSIRVRFLFDVQWSAWRRRCRGLRRRRRAGRNRAGGGRF